MPPKRKKKTTKKISLPPKKSTKKKSTSSKKSSKPTKLKNQFDIQAQLQKEEGKALAFPRILLYGKFGTSKTHCLAGAQEQERYENDKFIVNPFSPMRIIDCNYAARDISIKDYPKAYRSGKIIVINAFEDPETGLTIADPIKRVAAIRKLIDTCATFKDGAVGIDGFDAIEKDCMHYIYRQFKIFEKDDGTLWYREKVEYDKGTPRKVPERPCNGIIPRMYAPRNNQLRAILRKLMGLKLPVIITSHAEEEYKNDQATGKMIANVREFIQDEMGFMVYMENIIGKSTVTEMGITRVVENTGRRITFTKNRMQKGANPEIKIITKPKFEFTDIFKALMGEEI